ncbi:MAG TPA: DUF2752 domain-containing protein [Phycisphaerales bacterium]|nr:DUF2752 domain-containing protein [Phycisphaerales bacterium]
MSQANTATPPSTAVTPPTTYPQRAGRATRIGAAVAAVGMLAVLLLAATLRANPVGHGTHRQLGMAPCGFAVATGKPCPTCGMTTAFTHTAHGNYLKAFTTQPGGMLASLGVAAMLWVCLHTALTGSRSLELCGKLLTPKALWIAAGIWLGSWAYTFVTWNPA